MKVPSKEGPRCHAACLILGYCDVRNRQGNELNNVLRLHGFRSRLLQVDGTSVPDRGVIGIPRPQWGWLWRIRLGSKIVRWRLLREGLRYPHRVTVAVNVYAILPALLLKWAFRTRLVFYSLEYCRLDWLHKAIVRVSCDAIIDVEETRLALLQQQIGREFPSMVVYNMPRYVERATLKPHLRSWLVAQGLATETTFLAVYAGSHQTYCNLAAIVAWASEFPENAKLVLMIKDVPDSLRKHATANVMFAPAQDHGEFYNWLVDADVSLLPYEAHDDNVRYCSPQKLFDCLACGVPILGSKRPLIQKIVNQHACGRTIDFTDRQAFLDAINWFQKQPRDIMRAHAREAHENLNYDRVAKQLVAFLFGGLDHFRRGTRNPAWLS